MLDWVRPGTAGAIAPVLGPPAAPLINGRDAFSQQANVGVQPTFSWSPPALGTATSYSVRIDMANGDAPLPPGLQEVTLSVYTGTSVRVPQGFLQVGKPYVATITAFSAPWDQLDRPPLRLGAPLHSSDCVTAIFVP